MSMNSKQKIFISVALMSLLAACATGSGRNSDQDLDGVPDISDRCPLSVPGAAVGSDGCAADRDGDGVADLLDRCPNTPRNTQVDLVGCAIDSDCDGVPNGKDQCPRTLLGQRVNEVGCVGVAAVDSDGDGVLDPADLCPGTPPGTKVDADGCGDHELIIIEGVNFDNDKFNLKAGAIKTLEDVVAKMRRLPTHSVAIAGHTDWNNTDEYNMKLSENRAKVVFDFLVSAGIEPSRLSVSWFGESRPIADNSTAAGRAKNRRTELRLYKTR